MGDITVGRDTRRLRQEITVMRKIIIPFIILFLAACTTPGKRGRMHELLLQAQRQNQEYTPFTSDSIGKVLVEYYDRYGNANEQMLAHYGGINHIDIWNKGIPGSGIYQSKDVWFWDIK